MKLILRCVLVVLIYSVGLQALIIPDDLPSILSVIYSNIPTIKKGTDSRYGWGFRFGDRADFQILTELGPQIYTQPLRNQEDKDTNNKRETLNTLSNTLYAQREQKKKEKERLEKEQHRTQKDSEGAAWLQSWSQEVSSSENKATLPEDAKPGLAVGEIDAKSVLPDDKELERIENLEKMKRNLKKLLSKMQTVENKEPKNTQKSSIIKEENLDDVSLD